MNQKELTMKANIPSNPFVSRRHLLGAGLAGAALPLLNACGSNLNPTEDPGEVESQALASPASQGFFMPDESVPHLRSWMAWPTRRDIWQASLEPLRGDMVRLARTIRQFEPVTVVVRSDQMVSARRRLDANIDLLAFPIDDAWIRDTGPTFLINGKGAKAGSVFNFNAWGYKQPYSSDARLAGRMLQYLGLQAFKAPIVTEGGAIETDGEGTVLTTESALLNSNRNPGKSKAQVTEALKGWLGASKVIWLPGGNDYYTDGHIDGYARFVRPGVVLCEITDDRSYEDYDYTIANLKALQGASDARGRRLEVITVQRPRLDKARMGSSEFFAPDYVNYYVVNGGVIVPEFGDSSRDLAARDLVARLYPSRRVVQINIDQIASGGGGIHCFTQQEPKV
jgi:agmatine deiminase